MRYDPLNQTPSGSVVAQPSTPNPQPQAKRVSFGAIAKKTEKADDTPVFPDPSGEAATLAARISQRDAQLDALESAFETDKAELSQILVRPWYFATYHGRVEVPSSVLVRYPLPSLPSSPSRDTFGSVRVSVKDAYTAVSEDQVRALLGDAATDTYFRQVFEVKISGDKLGERAQGFIDDLQALAQKHGCLDAISFKDALKPKADFKARRFTELTLEQNLALEQLGEKGLTQLSVSAKTKR